MSTELDPQARALLDEFSAEGLPPTYALSVEEARDRLVRLFAPDEGDELEPVGDVRELSIAGPDGSIPLRVYRPDGEPPFPTLVYFHGGGWVLGTLDTHDSVCRTLTNLAECAVVSVDYRLAPEHPFPAAVEDTYAATRWVADHAGRIHVDPDRIAVGGDSAGGNLAAATALMARDRGGPALVHQSLIYPALNPPRLNPLPSYDENAEGYFLEYESMEWFYDHYVPHQTDRRNEYAFPLLARDLSGLPSATVLTCGFDPLRDEGIEYAKRLEATGVDVDHVNYDRMIHGFLNLSDVIHRGQDGIEDIADGLRRAFA